MGAVDETPRMRVPQLSQMNEETRRNMPHTAFFSSPIATIIAAMLITVSALVSVIASADGSDHVVVTKKEQTLKAVIQEVLRSSRFADPIASYNGIDSIGAVLPLGTTVRIPKPYIEVLNFGQIAFVKGDVTLAKANSVINPPGKGSLVHNGDIIRTGDSGFVSVSFHSGAQFSLQPGSVVQVNNVRCLEPSQECVIELEATKGSLTSEVTPKTEGKPVEFSVTTPFLSAAVRGTVFYIDVDESVNRIGVTRGLVAADSAGAQVDLPSGKGLVATESSPPTQVDLLPAPVSRTGQDNVYSAEDLFNWQSVDGARSYQVKLAIDPALTEVALLGQVNVTEYSAALAAGDYFLSVAAVDDADFVGMPLITTVRIADISDEIQPELKIERRGGTVTLQLTGDNADHNGPVELHIGKSIDAKPEQIELIDNLSQPLNLELSEDESWVFRVRKVIGPYAVSAYSNYYQLPAR